MKRLLPILLLLAATFARAAVEHVLVIGCDGPHLQDYALLREACLGTVKKSLVSPLTGGFASGTIHPMKNPATIPMIQRTPTGLPKIKWCIETLKWAGWQYKFTEPAHDSDTGHTYTV
jgi:hypothetical protein